MENREAIDLPLSEAPCCRSMPPLHYAEQLGFGQGISLGDIPYIFLLGIFSISQIHLQSGLFANKVLDGSTYNTVQAW
jgi:hypothetical protein